MSDNDQVRQQAKLRAMMLGLPVTPIDAAFDFLDAMHQIQQMSGPSAAEAEEIQRKLLEWARQEE